MIYTLDQHRVKTVGDNFYIAPNATVLGQVELGEDVSVWFGAVIRGDVEKIIIGKGSNIQDLSVLHVDPGSPIIIGENVTVGHKVMLHGCTIGNNSLVGINSVILNNVEIGNNCLIGAILFSQREQKFQTTRLLWDLQERLRKRLMRI